MTTCVSKVLYRVRKTETKTFDNEEMNELDEAGIEFDEEGRVIYKGGHDEEWKRRGKGYLYEYDGNQLKDIYDCKDGKKTVKRVEFEDCSMKELNDNGFVVYEGGYEGSPEKGFVRNDEGKEFDESGTLIYSGDWKNGKKEGSGIFYSGGHKRYSGEWKNDKPNGDGGLYNDEVVLMNGEWKDGFLKLENGLWKWYEDGSLCDLYENGDLKYKGEWKDGKPDGEGTFYRDGKVLHEGRWRNGYYNLYWFIWFCYANNDIRFAIPLWKKHIPQFLTKFFSLEEVTNRDTAKSKICLFYDVLKAFALCLFLLVAPLIVGLILFVAPSIYGLILFVARLMFGLIYDVASLIFGLILFVARLMFDSVCDVASLMFDLVCDVASLMFDLVCDVASLIFGLICFVIKLPIIIHDMIIKSFQCDIIRNLDSSITELIIPENSCRDAVRLDITGFKYLKSITIKRNAFYNTSLVVIKSRMIDD